MHQGGLVKITRREDARPAEGEAARPAPPAVSALRQGLRDAASLLPSRDAAKNSRFKLALYVAWGVPTWYALAAVLVLALAPVHAALGPLMAVFFLASLIGPIATTFLSALPVTTAFYALQGKDVEGRLRQALICPYCRDEVGREGTVICARKGCGALYHDECWSECAQAYGGCAIYGCSSRKCREISAAGYVLRLGRLAVAAVLFPPRIARAMVSSERESFRAIYRRAVGASNLVAASANPAENPPRKMALYILVSIPVAFAIALAYVSWVTPHVWYPRVGSYGKTFVERVEMYFQRPYALAMFAGLVTGIAFLLPRLVALPPALVYYTYRSIAEVLKSELAALARGDAGGGTVLGRLAAGFGKKSV